MAPEIRVAGPADVPAIRGLLAAHGNDDAPGSAEGPDIVGPYVRHLVARHRALVAEESGTVVAYGAVVDAGVAVHLADLFVDPERLGRGIGGAVLATLYAGLADGTPRTTFASDDPRAMPAYVRAGMLPRWPMLYLEGFGAALAPVVGVRARDAGPAELAALELAWTGADRPADHAFWASQAGADAFVVEDAGGPVALGYARDRQISRDVRAIDRLVVRPGAEPVGAIVAALRRSSRDGRVQACVPGPNPAVPALLASGFRIVDRDTYMSSTPDPVDAARLLPNSGML